MGWTSKLYFGDLLYISEILKVLFLSQHAHIYDFEGKFEKKFHNLMKNDEGG